MMDMTSTPMKSILMSTGTVVAAVAVVAEEAAVADGVAVVKKVDGVAVVEVVVAVARQERARQASPARRLLAKS
jgi:hypothetical protein